MGTPLAGYGGSVVIGSSHTVLNLSSWEVPLATDMSDTSSLGSNWKSSVPGLSGAVVKCSGFFDPGDTDGQVALMNAQLGNTTVSPQFTLPGGSHYFSGTAWVSNTDIKNPVNNVVSVDFTLTMTGEVSYT